jgi:lipopolysaccharide/colanic/teichoic acid biosynthesis glycosyltransferase
LLAYEAQYDGATYSGIAMFSLPVWLVIFLFHGLYRRDNLLGGLVEYQQVTKAVTTGIITLMVVSFLWRDVVMVSRGWLLFTWVISSGLIVACRFTMRRVVYRLRRKGLFNARVLIVGANDQGVAMAHQWRQSPSSGMEIIGFLDDFKPIGTSVVDDIKVIGQASALSQMAGRLCVHEVVMVPNAVAWETFEEIITQASNDKRFTLRVSPGFYALSTSGVAVTNKTFVPLFTLHEARIVGVDAILKALLDYGVGIPLLLLTLLPMALIALGLKLTGVTQVLARHRTIGQGGRMFTMFKFNTDARRSWVDRLLIRWGADKMPQTLNVVLGEMSLVGPRPRVIAAEPAEAHHTHYLQSVKPGLIGPWMASPGWSSSDESNDELYYVRNWTIELDIQLLVQAVLSLFGARRTAGQAG